MKAGELHRGHRGRGTEAAEKKAAEKRKVSCEKLLIHVGALESAGTERFGVGLERRVDGYLVIAR
jgi:hypothetical protein